VLGTQETFCIVIAGLLERYSFDLFLPEFDKPWVIHLRETCCCSTNSALGGPTLSTRTDADEDIPTVDTTVAPTATLSHIPQFQGPLTRARARQLNYKVLSFLGTIPNIHENMMLPKSDVFMLLRNDGPSMDERDKHWSMIVHGDDGSNRVRIQDDATSEDFRTLKTP
jgi:hypothetical protein